VERLAKRHQAISRRGNGAWRGPPAADHMIIVDTTVMSGTT